MKIKKNDLTRGLILKAAEKIFARDGFNTASIDDVALEAGIAKGTVYYHFKSKDEIFFEIIDDGINQLAEKIQKQIENNAKSGKSSLYVLIETHFSFFKERKEFCQVLFSELWRLKTRWQRDIILLKAKYHQVVINTIEKSGFKSDIPDDVIANYIFWLVSMICLNTVLYEPENADQAVKQLYSFILKSQNIKK